jgi:hypothetical protein
MLKGDRSHSAREYQTKEGYDEQTDMRMGLM